jgi:hypothetical protein
MDVIQLLLTTLVIILSVLSIALLATAVIVAVAVKRLSRKLELTLAQSSNAIKSIRLGALKTTGTLGIVRMIWGLVRRKSNKR